MEDVPENCLEEFIKGAHRVAQYGLVVCASGNLSWRMNDSLMLITASGSWMANIRKDQVAVCKIMDPASTNGKEPSKEVGFHAAILRERSDVNVVLHCQSPSATTLSCRQPAMQDFSVIPEIPYHIGSVAVIPYLAPGSRELAEALTSAMVGHDLAILRNHGQVVVGEGFDQVIAKAMYFELACKIILGAGEQAQFLSADDVAELYRKGKASRIGLGRGGNIT